MGHRVKREQTFDTVSCITISHVLEQGNEYTRSSSNLLSQTYAFFQVGENDERKLGREVARVIRKRPIMKG